ncbi:ABC transporter permease subunit [Nordella sp. HKS 07]|uniref:ABC transporter permease n=1 Tax=Nordella sp. HKS 07 TaxID=2712222 RepID=UPI0013E1A058|nr:ABC transporter permease subunit [Nordella sp. HKS 07]QIG49793.1 ABC transporter permease subunit [Nordella sp. HKS 07]
MMLDWETFVTYVPLLIQGAVTTIELTMLVALFGFLIALPVALARNSASRAARAFAQSFIFFFRGAPILAVLFLLYYGLPQIPGIKESILWHLIARPMPIAVLALSLNSAGFLAEIFAIALRNVAVGDIEAARAFGFGRVQTFFRFALPGAARLCIRAYGNELVFVLKGTAAVNFITITDLIGAANQIYFNTFDPITPLLVAGAIYLVFALLIVTCIRGMERRLSPWLFIETKLKET